MTTSDVTARKLTSLVGGLIPLLQKSVLQLHDSIVYLPKRKMGVVHK
jgi:hypothetical protein